MKQVLQSPRADKPTLKDVPPPQCGAGEVLVATKASLISAGTERMLMEFSGKSMLGKAKERPDLAKKVLTKLQRDGLVPTARSVLAQLESPLPLGYSAAGEVVEVGEKLKGRYKKGDAVLVAGAGLANHAEINAVPANLVAPMPQGVRFEDAAYGTLGAIALHGVRNAHLTLGDKVLVLGLGLVGQLAAQLATISGGRVMGIDFSADRLALAKETNACAATVNLGKEDADAAVAAFTNGRGFDAVLICAATDSNQPLQQAIGWARDRANVVMVGKVGTEVPYADFMKKELNLTISRSYGPGRYDPNYEQKGQTYPAGYVPWTERDNLAEIANLIADGKLDVTALTSHSFDITEAEQAYELITSDTPCLGVVLTYPDAAKALKQTKITLAGTTQLPGNGTLGVACIGAGSFAGSVLLPALSKQENISLTGVASKGGTSAQAAAERFDFGYATSKVEEILKDKKTNAVVISTRHNTHADLVQQALKAGKHVFVEKPLALTLEELQDVYKTWRKHPQTLLVGYNRRFAPQIQALQKRLPHQGPRQILIRVNAGQLPGDNWQNDASIGGGRLLGEVCHFLDLALALSNAKPTQLYAVKGEGQDNYSLTLSFANGSTAQVFYTSEGDTSVSKERIEVFAGGSVGIVDNFLKASFTQNGRTRSLGRTNWLMGQDKGHAAELAAFTDASRTSAMPIPAEDLFLSAALPLLAVESLKTEAPVKVEAW